MRRFTLFVLFSAVACGPVLVGCDSTANHTEKKPVPSKEDEHEHHHHGPNGGHIAGTPDEKYHVEWTQDGDSGKVNLYVLDSHAEKEVPIEASELVIVTKQGDESKEYTLTAVEPVDGKTARFEVVDKDLVGALEALSEQITAKVKSLPVGEKTYEDVQLTMDHHH